MSTYIIYDKATGDIVHVHSEYYMGSEDTLEVDKKRMMEELGDILPDDVELGVLASEETPQPKRGYRYYVDLTATQLMLVERPPREKEKQQ
jgi:hypothetical protein